MTSKVRTVEHECQKCGRVFQCERCPSMSGDRDVAVCSECTFSLMCSECDAGMDVVSYEQAMLRGWSDMMPDDHGMSWTWLGTCPDCKMAELQGLAVAGDKTDG